LPIRPCVKDGVVMSGNRIELTDELIQRFYDGELEECLRSAVESALASSPEHARALERYRRLGGLLQEYAGRMQPDELTVRRNWEEISRAAAMPNKRSFLRRRLPWLSAAAAAAAVAALLFLPAQQTMSAEVESIDCTYSSFMVLNPDSDDTHTIVWIDDSGN
jgi:anti-sigma factor RsiW